MRPPLTNTALCICYRKYFIVVCIFFLWYFSISNSSKNSSGLQHLYEAWNRYLFQKFTTHWNDGENHKSLIEKSKILSHTIFFIRASWAWTSTCRTIFGCPELFVSNKLCVNCNFRNLQLLPYLRNRQSHAVDHYYTFRFIINTFRPAGIYASHRLRGTLQEKFA